MIRVCGCTSCFQVTVCVLRVLRVLLVALVKREGASVLKLLRRNLPHTRVERHVTKIASLVSHPRRRHAIKPAAHVAAAVRRDGIDNDKKAYEFEWGGGWEQVSERARVAIVAATTETLCVHSDVCLHSLGHACGSSPPTPRRLQPHSDTPRCLKAGSSDSANASKGETPRSRQWNTRASVAAPALGHKNDAGFSTACGVTVGGRKPEQGATPRNGQKTQARIWESDPSVERPAGEEEPGRFLTRTTEHNTCHVTGAASPTRGDHPRQDLLPPIPPPRSLSGPRDPPCRRHHGHRHRHHHPRQHSTCHDIQRWQEKERPRAGAEEEGQ